MTRHPRTGKTRRFQNPHHPLAVWLRDRDMTLREAGKRWGVSHAALSLILTRKHRPRWSLVVKISKDTRIPVMDLLDRTPAERDLRHRTARSEACRGVAGHGAARRGTAGQRRRRG